MNILRLLLPILAVCVLPSCASVSVKDERRAARPPVRKPERIYVADFRTDLGTYEAAGSEGSDLEAFKSKTATTLTTNLVKSLDAHVAPATRTSTVSRLPSRGWLVTGHFVRVNAGNRLLRMSIGLGAGATKMETQVQVCDLASGKKPFLTFATTGGSNAMPGVIVSTSPVGVVLNIVRQARRGVTDDCARTSRMIAGVLNEYLVDRGWRPESQRYSVKRPGQFQLLHEHFSP